MIRNYLAVALRNLARGKLYALINIVGLAIGMAGTFLVLVYIQGEVGYDSHHANYYRIYRVTTVRPQWDMIKASSASPLANAVRESIPAIEQAARLVYVPTLVKLQDGRQREYCLSAESTVFDVFSWPLVAGSREHVLTEPNSVVLTESLAEKYYTDDDAIGKTLQVRVRSRDYQLTVVGVMQDHPRKATLQPAMLVSEEIGRAYHQDLYAGVDRDPSEDWTIQHAHTYLLLDEGADPTVVESALGPMLTRLVPPDLDISLRLQPLSDIYFGSSHLNSNNMREGNLRAIFTFAGIAALVLFLAVANFVVLTTAQLVTRSRELTMRRVVGASRAHLAMQLLAESGLVVALALPVALGLVELGLPQINTWFGTRLDVWASLGTFVVGAAAVAALVAIMSSAAAMFHVRRAGLATPSLTNITSPRGRTFFRRGVVLVQISILAGLFIAVGVVLKQVNFATSEDPGYALHDLASAYLSTNDAIQNYGVLKTELERCPGVISVSGATMLPPYDGRGMFKATSPIDPELTISVESMVGDVGLIETLSLEMKEGRSFDPELDAVNNLNMVINETMAAALGLEDPLGAVIGNQTVIGVLKDFHFHSTRMKIEPMALTQNPQYVRSVAVRLDPEVRTKALAAINDVWNRINPDAGEGFYAADDILAAMYREESKFGDVITFFSFLAAVIAGMGLFGLSLFVARQRTKEIGIRKTMGAPMGHLVRVLAQEHFVLVLIANLLAGAPAYWAMSRWLDNFIYKTTISWEVFVLSGLLTLVLSTVTVGLHSIRTARANPVEALKYE